MCSCLWEIEQEEVKKMSISLQRDPQCLKYFTMSRKQFEDSFAFKLLDFN